MKKFMENYGNQLLTLIVSGFIYMFVNLVTPENGEILTFFRGCICFAFGLSLFQYRKSRAWGKKVFIAVLFIFLLLLDMGYDIVPQIANIISYLNLKGFLLNLVYVFLGWTFFN